MRYEVNEYNEALGSGRWWVGRYDSENEAITDIAGKLPCVRAFMRYQVVDVKTGEVTHTFHGLR